MIKRVASFIRPYTGLFLLWCTATPIHSQTRGLDNLEPIGAFLDGVFPSTTPGVAGAPEPPARLSQTGAFTDLASLTPRTGLLPYAVNAPLWTDGSVKHRWIAIPNDGTADSSSEQITFDPLDSWHFPNGTVFIKQFDLPNDERNPLQIRRVETRFLVHGTDGVYYGVTYRWRADGTDADLLLDGESEDLDITTLDGSVMTQEWSHPSREDCLNCHNVNAGSVLGIRTHQLNGDYPYESTGRTDNQLRTWNHLGLFTQTLDETAISTYLQSSPIDDTNSTVETRIRSYLDSNCSQCHRPDQLTTAIDMRFTTPLEQQNLVDEPVLYDLGVADARVIAPQSIARSILHRRMSAVGVHQMPPLGRNVVDDNAVSLLSEWILSLTPDSEVEENRSPVAQNDEANTIQETAVDIPVLSNDADVDGDPLAIESWTSPNHGTLTWLTNQFARYTPESGFVGTDTFTYVIADDENAVSNTATVTIRVISNTNTSAITFLDRSSRLVNPADASGVAIGVADMDQDGLDDIVHLHLGKTLKVDYQNPDGADFSGHTLTTFSSKQWGLCLADADDNGYPDILSGGYYDDLHLQWNEGGRNQFTPVNLTSPRVFLQTVNFVDIDDDGLLDIFACHDVGDNAKFRNTGSRGFVYDNSLIDTRTTPTSDNSGNYGTVWTDYDNDGDLDLYLSKCRGGVSSSTDPRRVNMLFRNDGGTYTNVAPELGMDFGAQSWATDFGDVDNDGDLDAFIGNHSSKSLLMRNNGDGTFTDGTTASGISVTWRVIQTIFRDFNNDGWVDLLLVGASHQLWLNDRDGTFTKASNPFTSRTVESSAVGDLNRDGFTDVYAGYASLYNTPQTSRPDKLFLASPNGNGFLSVTLEGVTSNKSAVGARLELHGPWGIQVREVRGGESYGIAHSFTQIFGMGNAVSADKLRVRWPQGAVDEILDVAPNQFLELREGSSQAPTLTNPGPQANQVNELVTLTIEASDPTGDLLTFQAVNLPAGLQIDESTGAVTGTLTPESAGSYTVIVQVSDSWSTISETFAWEVLPPDAPPAVVLSTASASVTGPFTVSARFTSEITGLTPSDFQVTNGSAGSLSGGGMDYQFTVTPSAPGDVIVQLPADRVIDDGGQGNLASNLLPITYRLPFTPPEITSFTANPDTVSQGSSATLSWSVSNGGAPLTQLEITPSVGSVLGQNQKDVSPTATTTYTIIAANSEGSVSTQTTVTVTVPPPSEDALSNFQAPGSVRHAETVNVSIDYAATERRELWIWLQDSNDGWRTASSDFVVVEAGSATHTFSLTIDGGARIGDGYVWAVRLLPTGWTSGADTLDEAFSLADVQAGTEPPDRDLLGAIALPEVVLSPDTVSLAVPYQATERREIQVYLHDSTNGWFTVAQGGITVDPGVGTHTFQLPVINDARVGDGYVWAIRLFPLGWTVADDALDADYGNASIERNTGGPATQDILTNVMAPGNVEPAALVQVTVDYEATERRDLAIWLHDSTNNWRTIGQGLVKVDPGIGTQTFSIGIVGDARVGSGYVWAVRLMPEGWVQADEAFDAFYADATVNERITDLVNLAVLPEASATQSSVYGVAYVANRARDGNTDGDWRNGSVTHTELDIDAWWEIDLGQVRAVDHLLLWNRTDCCGDRLAPYHVFASDVPFISQSVSETAAQSGVSQFTFTETPLPTQRVDLNRAARYIRVQLAGANYLSLAEVEVYGSLSGALVNGLTYSYYEGTWPDLPDFEAINPLQTGTVTNFDLNTRARDDFFAIRFLGCLAAPADGAYTFHLTADHGARLLLNGLEVVASAEGQETSATVNLADGMQTLELQYFERDAEEALILEWQGPGISRSAIPDDVLWVNETGATLGFHHVGRRVPAYDNADGDLLDLTAEYALGRDPTRAAHSDIGLRLEAHDADTRLTVSYDRPASLSEIDYWLEVSDNLTEWHTVLSPTDIDSTRYGWERVVYDHVEQAHGVSIARGFVRLRIRHHDWNHETTTPICGWYQTVFEEGYQTHGVSLNASPIFASVIAEADSSKGLLYLTADGLLEAMGTGPHYAEFADGPWEGHRFTVDSDRTSNQILALHLSDPANTLTELPETGLRFSRIVIRPHFTLSSIYPPNQFNANRDPDQADQIRLYDGRRYHSYFLLEGGAARYWSPAEASLENRNDLIIPPGTGALLERADGSEAITHLTVGHLRPHGFIQPLRAGYNFIAPVTPLETSPLSRGLTNNAALTPNTDPGTADQLRLWLGPDRGFADYFLRQDNESGYWARTDDLSRVSQDEELLFEGNRAFFFNAQHAASHYRVPAIKISEE